MQTIRSRFSSHLVLPFICTSTLVSVGISSETAQAAPRKTSQKAHLKNPAPSKVAHSLAKSVKAPEVPAPYLLVAPYVQVAATDAKSALPALPAVPGTVTLTKEAWQNAAGVTATENTKWTQTVPDAALGERAAKIKQMMEVALNESALKVDVLPNGNGFVASIAGQINPNDQSHVNEVVDGFIISSNNPGGLVWRIFRNITNTAPKAPAAPDLPKQMSYVLPLTFIHSPLLLSGQDTSNDGNGEDSIDQLLGIVNQNFKDGKTEAKDIVKRVGNGRTLIFKGTAEEIYSAKRNIMLYDLPWSQVQLDVWSFQVSGAPEEVETKMLQIRQQATLRRDLLHLAQDALAKALRQNNWRLKTDFLIVDIHQTVCDLEYIGFSCDASQSLSLSEEFVLLALAGADTRKNILNDWETIFRNDAYNASAASEKQGSAGTALLTKRLKMPNTIFPHVRAALGMNDKGIVRPDAVIADRQAITAFVKELKQLREERAKEISNQPDDMTPDKFYRPERLANTAATADDLMRVGVDSYITDLQDLLFSSWLLNLSEKSGTSLRGKTRLVVTSGLETYLQPTVSTYVNTTRPKPLDFSTLFGNFDVPSKPDTKDKTKSATDEAMGAATRTLLTNLSDTQLLALRLLTNQTQQVYTQVAPGVSVDVRPTVLRDGASARLKMHVKFGLDTIGEIGSEGNNGVYKSVPAPMVKSHEVTTDAAISALDLFDISSFSLQTSYPRSRYLPVIGSIPLIGELIKRPAKNKITTHESMILVNAVIVPRALDVARFYESGGNQASVCPPICPPTPTAPAPK